MAVKTEYICDLCQRSALRLAALKVMFGVRFSNNTDFTLTDVTNTDGKHLCDDCCKQLKKWLNERDSI